MTPWEKALEEGNPQTAAQLSYAAYAEGRRDLETAVFAFRAQCGTGYFEEAVEILADNPKAAQTTGSFISLLNMIAMTGAIDLVDSLNLFPVMQSNEAQHPGVSEFGVRIAAHCLRRDPEHARARLFLHSILPTLIARQDFNLLRCALVPVADADRALMLRRIAGALGGIPAPLLPEAARFSADSADILCGVETVEGGFDSVFPPRSIVWRVASGAARMQLAEDEPAELSQPVLDRDSIAANARALRQAAADFLASAPGHPYDRYGGISAEASPIIVLSTGRVGTMAMETLLKRSDTLRPFHSLNLQVETGDQNALLYKLMAERPSDFTRDIRTALHYRFSEFAYCHAAGKTPVIVNHLDTVTAPILLGAFPNARLIRMHRAPEKTLLSLAYKNQFGFRQLRHLKGRFEDDTGEFVFRRDRTLSIEQECSWYMHVTDLLANIFGTELARPGRFLDLDMEQIFGLADAPLAQLADFLDDHAISADTCREVFSRRINEKSFYTFDPEQGDLGRLAGAWGEAHSTLSRQGKFDPSA